jgi:ADP-ribose pyrophosphatase YjhB (NUDIX family)
MRKVVAGGIIEKDGKYLLVQETQEHCRGQWNIPAGGVDDGENVIDAAKREVFEETGCKVEITGILEIVNRNLEDRDVIIFIFDTKLIEENIQIDGEEISDVKWFSYEEILNMKKDLRAGGYFISALNNKKENKINPLELIRIESRK